LENEFSLVVGQNGAGNVGGLVLDGDLGDGDGGGIFHAAAQATLIGLGPKQRYKARQNKRECKGTEAHDTPLSRSLIFQALLLRTLSEGVLWGIRAADWVSWDLVWVESGAGIRHAGRTRPGEHHVIEPAGEIERTTNRNGGDGVDQQSGKGGGEEGS